MNQVGNVVLQNTKRRLLTGCLSALVGVPLMVCCLVLIFTVVLPQLDKFVTSEQTDLLPIVLLGIGALIIFVLIVGPVILFIIIIRNRANLLDAVFQPLGLQGSMYMLVGRHYWGTFSGRDLDIYIYRGPTMEIHLSSQSHTRVQILPNTSLPVTISAILNKDPIQLPNRQLENCAIYTEDEIWARKLFSNEQVNSALLSLLFGHADWAIFRHVEIHPDRILLYLHRSKQLFTNRDQFSAAEVWINSMVTMATVIEEMEEPSVTLQPFSTMSREHKQKLSKTQLIFVLIILIGLPLCLLAIGVLTYLLVSI